MFSNKFAVLQVHNVNPKQTPKQPKPKGDKEVNSVPGPKNDQKEEVNSNENRPVRDNNNRRGGEYRGRGGNRGGRGGNRGGRGGSSVEQKDPALRNKRRYDRNSNVPKNESKKGNFGAGNWGTEKEDARGSEDAKKEVQKVSGEDAGSEVKAEGENVVVEQAPEDKTISLKEYEEQRAALAPKIEAPKRREAGEGEKNNELEKFTALKKGDDDDEFVKLNIKIKEKKKKSAQPKKPQAISLDVFQEGNSNNNNNNNNRGGKKPYNNNNRNKPKKLNISIEDHTNFPALGK